MPGAANAMMRSAAQGGGGGAAPRSLLADGINQWVDPGWTMPALGSAGTIGVVFKAPAPPSSVYRIIDAATNALGAARGRVYYWNDTGIQVYGWRSSANEGTIAAANRNFLASDTWGDWCVSQPGGGATYCTSYLDGVASGAGSASNISDAAGALVLFRRADSLGYTPGYLRCWYRCPATALSGAQVVALHALIAAGDDAGAAAYLLGIDPTAQYHAVTEASDLTSGTVGGIADLTGNSAGSTPWNTTTAGNLSTDVP